MALLLALAAGRRMSTQRTTQPLGDRVSGAGANTLVTASARALAVTAQHEDTDTTAFDELVNFSIGKL